MTETSKSTAVDLERLRATIAEVLELDLDELTDDARFVEDLGVDSLIGLELQITLEVRYGVSLTEDDLRRATSLRTAHALLTAMLAERSYPAA
ncbi:acyl carrier protein [Streptomyces griseochromogenes]